MKKPIVLGIIDDSATGKALGVAGLARGRSADDAKYNGLLHFYSP